MDQRKRAQRAMQPRMANGAQADMNHSSDEDEEVVAVPRASSRRQSRVDFSKLETSSLRKYRKFYELPDVPGTTKDELIPLVARHFAQQQVLDEGDTLVSFVMALKKQGQRSMKPNGGQIKKPRNGPKPKAR